MTQFVKQNNYKNKIENTHKSYLAGAEMEKKENQLEQIVNNKVQLDFLQSLVEHRKLDSTKDTMYSRSTMSPRSPRSSRSPDMKKRKMRKVAKDQLNKKLYEKYKNMIMINNSKYTEEEFNEILNGIAWPTKKIKYKSIGLFSEGGQAQLHLFLKRKEIKITNDKFYYAYINEKGNFVFLHGWQYDKLGHFLKDNPKMKKVICRGLNGQELPKKGYFKIDCKENNITSIHRDEFNKERKRDHILEEKFYVGKIFKEKKFYQKELKIYEKLKQCAEVEGLNEEDMYTIILQDKDDNRNVLYFDYLDNYQNMKEFRMKMLYNMAKRQRILNDELSYSYDDFDIDNNILGNYDYRETLLSFGSWLKIVKNLLKSVYFIHRNNIYHRDLSLGNIMIDEYTNKVLLIDFGFSWTPDDMSSPKETSGMKKNLEQYAEHRDSIIECDEKNGFVRKLNNFAISQVGTLRFIAPEVLIKNNKYDPEKADMWSLGCILYSLLFGKYPYSTPFKRDEKYVSYYEKSIEEDVKKCYYNMEKFDHDQIQLISFLINNCKKIKPQNRRSVNELIDAIELYESFISRKQLTSFGRIPSC
jgi:serine/threonine protein kinase